MGRIGEQDRGAGEREVKGKRPQAQSLQLWWRNLTDPHCLHVRCIKGSSPSLEGNLVHEGPLSH